MSGRPSFLPDPRWQEKYRDMIMTPARAAGLLQPGNRAFIGTGCAEPIALVQALTDRAGELADVEIVHLLMMGEAPYADRKMSECFRVNSFFIAENVRGHIQEGLGDYTPIIVFAIASDGALREIQRRPTEGREPREFAIAPDGRFLLIANQLSDDVVVIGRDPDSGTLGETLQTLPVERPSDIKFFTPN